MKSITWTGRKDTVVVRGSLDADSLEDAIAVLKNRGIGQVIKLLIEIHQHMYANIKCYSKRFKRGCLVAQVVRSGMFIRASLVTVSVPVGTNKAIDKNSTPHHSGSNHETKV